jgi:hypothetical protein
MENNNFNSLFEEITSPQSEPAIISKPKKNCKTCGKEVTRFLKSTKDWSTWCCNKCMSIDPDILKKKQETNVRLYGSHPMHNPELKQKQLDTCIAKYGTTNVFGSEYGKKKLRETHMAKYGVDNPSKNSQIIERIREDAIERYRNNKEEILEKRKKTCMENYNVEWNSQRHLSLDSIEKMHDIEYIMHQHFELGKPCNQIAKELGCSTIPIFQTLENNGLSPIRNSSSTGEQQLHDFIKSIISDEIIKNDRTILKPKEIDIYIPTRGIAFEYNGIYWHSELHGKTKEYHVDKIDSCEKQNIRLIQIFEPEWFTKQEIVKSRIRNIFGLSKKIFARKCKIVELTSAIANKFIDENHIQGKCSASVYIGLEYENQLVAVASYSKSRFSKKYEWELIRFCNLLDYTVVGGFSKINTYFKNKYKPTSIVSYADRRWSVGNLYESCGFTLVHHSQPNYSYFHSKNVEVLFSRQQFQKHLLKNKLPVFDENLTEWGNMKANGYNRIWDSGNRVYLWRNNGNLS